MNKTICIAMLALPSLAFCAETLTLTSPSGVNEISMRKPAGELTYSVSYKGNPVIVDLSLIHI